MGLRGHKANVENGKVRRNKSSSSSSSSTTSNSRSSSTSSFFSTFFSGTTTARKPTLLHLTMLTSIVAAAALSKSTIDAASAPAQEPSTSYTDQQSSALPFCNEIELDRSIGRRLLYVSTLDGRLSALDISKGGKLHWSIPTGPGPLVSSSIHRLELTNNGQFVRMIPSLSGVIYKFDGEFIDPIPVTTDNLLSSSAKFSEDLVVSGGKETRTYGVSARTGQVLYECSMHGCVNGTDALNGTSMDQQQQQEQQQEQQQRTPEEIEQLAKQYEHDTRLDDVIVVRRQTQTVRAVETRSGVERWNFSVGQHELNLIRSSECHEQEFSEMDMAILDLDVKIVVPEGIVCAFSKSEPNVMLWKHKFDHPIVNAWKIDSDDELESIDIFSAAQWLWEDDEHIFEAPKPSASPTIYLGMYEKQLYIQESTALRNEVLDHTELYNHLTENETKLPKIPWRPKLASSSSIVLFQDEKMQATGTLPTTGNGLQLNVHGNELVPYNEDNFAVAAQSVLNGSEYVNGNGFYLYKDSDHNRTDGSAEICDNSNLPAIDGPNNTNDVNNRTITDDMGFSLDDIDAPVKVVILSLWFWWKEIIVIAFTSAVLLNLFIGQRQRSEREIVVIERHIPVPTAIEATESSTQALLGPVNGSTSRSNSNYSNGRTLSESTSHSGDYFTSRFQDEFELVRYLGRGGFGVVFEARNKLDDCKYAVKRITLPNKLESRERVKREVKTLANCEHHNIVRYFQAWVETPPPGWQEEEDKKWVTHEMSTSIQIETPDGSTLPTFAHESEQHGPGHLHLEKKQQLLSWVSSVTSTACSSDFDGSGLNGVKESDEDNVDDEDDSYIVFQSDSGSFASRGECKAFEDDAETSNSSVKTAATKRRLNSVREQSTNKTDAISIDIHSNSFDYTKLSDSFQIEFVRSANGDCASVDPVAAHEALNSMSSESATGGKTNASKRSQLSLDLHREFSNQNNCKALLPAAQGTPSPPGATKPLQNKVYLYIQMQLCRKESLRDWLRENKAEQRRAHIPSIFYQIVDAVDYVHLKGLVHRDLKPSNIFFSQEGKVKIGDFGLVTDMSDIPNLVTKCSDTTGLPSCARHTQQVGTHLYMSPEQLHGKHYNFKVDIYSLGLIFFELLEYFGTEMERIHTLRDLRNGRYPAKFPDNYPAEHELLQLMLSTQPEVRPTTVELKQKLNDLLHWPNFDVGNSTTPSTPPLFDLPPEMQNGRIRTFSSAE